MREDRPLAEDVRRVFELIGSGNLVPEAPRWTSLVAAPES